MSIAAVVIITVLCTVTYLGIGALLASRFAIDTFSVALLTLAWPLAPVVIVVGLVAAMREDRRAQRRAGPR